MPPSLRLVHLTDFHLLGEADARLHGWHVQRALELVLDDICHAVPDAAAFVLGGDLVDDETAAGYARLDDRLAALGRPVLAMAGNHDDPARMAAYLRHARVHMRLEIGGWQLFALNSHLDSSEAGRVGARQLHDLDAQLGRHPNPALVFVHHPPCSVGSAWIDTIGLQDRDALATVIERHPHVRAIVCGHAHQQAALAFAGRPCLVTPATMRQFLPQSHGFAEDAQRAPGYRVLTLTPDGGMTSRVRRVEAARLACG